MIASGTKTDPFWTFVPNAKFNSQSFISAANPEWLRHCSNAKQMVRNTLSFAKDDAATDIAIEGIKTVIIEGGKMPTPQLAIITAGVVIAVLVPQLYETWKQHKKFHPDDLKPGERHTDPRDKVRYVKDKDGNLTTTEPNGTVTIENTDGTKITKFPDGSITTTSANGTTCTTYPDGRSITTKPDGTQILQAADKSKEIKYKDGTVETIDTYNNSLIRRPDGSLEGKFRDPDGVTHLYKNGQEYIKDANNQWVSVDTGAPLINPTSNNQA